MFNPHSLKELRDYYVDNFFTSTPWVEAICRQIVLDKIPVKNMQRDLILFAQYVVDSKYTGPEILRVFKAVGLDRLSPDDHEHLLHLVHDRILKGRRIRRIEGEWYCPADCGRYWALGEVRLASDPHQLSPKAKRLIWWRDHKDERVSSWAGGLGCAAFWVRKHDDLARRAKL